MERGRATYAEEECGGAGSEDCALLKKDGAKEDEAAIGKQVSIQEQPATKAGLPLPGNKTKLQVR